MISARNWKKKVRPFNKAYNRLLALICIAAVSNVEDPFDSIGSLFQLQFDHDKQGTTIEEEELIWGSIVSDLLMFLKGIP